jgi:hypothetical protein
MRPIATSPRFRRSSKRPFAIKAGSGVLNPRRVVPPALKR